MGVGLTVKVLQQTAVFAQRFVLSLRTQEQTFRVLYFFENVVGLLGEQAKRLGISKLMGRLRCAQGILGSATSSLVLTKFPGSLWTLKDTCVNFHQGGKENEAEIEKLTYDVATVVEDAAYVGLLLNTATLVQLASRTLNSMLFVANAAALYYDTLDLKNAIFSMEKAVITKQVNQDHLSKAEMQHLDEVKLLEMVKIAKTILHLAIDIIGILAVAFGVTLFSTTTTMSIICVYLLGSMWTHVYNGAIVEEEKAGIRPRIV